MSWPRSLNDWLNAGLVLFAFLLPISKPAGNAVLIMIVLLWLAEGEWRRKFALLSSNKPFVWFTLLLAWTGLSLLWSDTLSGGFFKGHDDNALIAYLRLSVFDYMLFPIVLTSMKQTTLRYVISAFLSAIFVSEIVSWGIFFEMIRYKDVPPNDPSPFMNHSLYSIFLAVAIFLLFMLWQESKDWKLRLFYTLFIVSATANLFLNGGRLGQLAFFVALFVYMIHNTRLAWKAVPLALILSSSIFFAAYQISPIFHKRVNLTIHSIEDIVQGKIDSSSSWKIRVNVYKVASDVIARHPLIGTGIGDSKRDFLQTARGYPHTGFFKELEHLHSQYLHVLLETGAVGLVLFLLFFIAVWRLPVPTWYAPFHRTFLIIYLVGFIGEPLWLNRQPYLLFLLFIAVADVLSRPKDF